MSMNKQDFVDALATRTGQSKKLTKEMLEATIEVIQESVAKGESITFVGFGTFKPVLKNSRTAKVPGTDKTVEVPEKTVPRFKAGKVFTSLVNSK